jgi:gliding motility-associated-like protein
VCSTAEPFNAETVLTNASPGGTWLFNGTPADDLTFDPSQNTSGVYTYVIPAIGPCPGQESAIEVIVDEGFAFSAGPDLEVCSLEGDVSFGINLCTNCTYDWTPSNLLENATTATPTFNVPFASQTTTYTFSVIASNGVCEVSDEVVFTVHPTPTLFVSGPFTLCDNETGLWNGAGAPDLVWTVEGEEEPTIGSSIQINPSENFTLSLTGTNEFGCTNTTAFEVEVLESPVFDFVSPSADGCAPFAISLDLPPSDNPDLTLSWMLDGNQYTQNSLVELSQAGVYDLTLLVASGNGCETEYTADAAIQVYPTPFPNFTYSPEALTALNPLVNFHNLTQDDADFVWDFGGMDESTAFSPSYIFPELPDMGYRVCLEATNAFGCSAATCQDLYFPGEMLVYVPSAFTPDNDGLNEVFKPVVTGFEPDSYLFSVFNRWGERIFTTNDAGAAWNGSVNGGNHYAPNGVYVWMVEVTDAYSAERLKLKGHVTLIR